ncbi:cobalamin B12-binding domain-containing protein [Sinanaerobacter sp. ZZT-01]|uniref:cobalamin B12-binding domain-containing protein n=1 Tax=Sinanaerobacter sp. ZZT-01 TaxID=3111540 RepID=UPI002D77E88C|nr:cobalamin-dependent protein [Sinanaerobacter sp. ZZT-01]WRR92586.1 cobalamin-dependent protein [Sinanaerobacter sp. ZZT-01]
MLNREEVKKTAAESIIDADEAKAFGLIDEILKLEDKEWVTILCDGFSDGNRLVGESFEKGKLSLPELIYCSEVMKNVMDRIIKRVDSIPVETTGKILIATVEGDVHDIGKGIVASALKLAGFEVIDLGREVSVDTIVEAAERCGVDIIGTSALLTSTLSEQKKLEMLLRDLGLRHKYKTMVGGAPCTARWAKKIGADAYSEDAMEAVKKAKELLKK